MNDEQMKRVAAGRGFIAALDQSGGSTPKALRIYGIPGDAYSGEDEMFDLVHLMRTRIITSPSFTGDHIIGAILFDETLDRQIEGRHSADYLWTVKRVVPFLKVDRGLDEEADGVQLMQPISQLDDLLARAHDKNVFGTKMRSVIKHADADGIAAIATQQFDVGRRILDAGLTPIIEPEIDIHSPTKVEAEYQLLDALLGGLDDLDDGQQVMFKLTLPQEGDFYLSLVEHPNVLRVVALSGGYSRAEAKARLACNHGIVASFSRALTEGLSVGQSPDEFNAQLDTSIKSIYKASIT